MARAYKALPPASELWERFEYKPLTGELIARFTLNSRCPKGKSVGALERDGYRKTSVGGMYFPVSRLIWRWVTGEDPGDLRVDHKNRDRDFNAFHNLRLGTARDNRNNTGASPRSKTGVKGVSLDGKKYRAQICHKGKRQTLGYFETVNEARAAYEKASLELHGEFSSVR